MEITKTFIKFVLEFNCSTIYKENAMRTFKLRAEAECDIFNLFAHEDFRCKDYKITRELPYDPEFEFESELSIYELKTILSDIPDSHVMMETLSDIMLYTGERIYDEPTNPWRTTF